MFIVLGVFLVSVLRLFHLLLQRLVLPRLRPRRRRRLPPIVSLPLLLPPPLLLLLLLLLLLVLLSVENGSPSPSMQVSGNSPATFRQTTRATHLPEKNIVTTLCFVDRSQYSSEMANYCANSVFCRSVTIVFFRQRTRQLTYFFRQLSLVSFASWSGWSVGADF